MSKRKTAATKTTVAQASGRRNEPKSQISSDGSGREYRAEGTDQEESADESTEWSRNDMEGSVTEEEAETAGGGRGVREIRRQRCRYQQEAEQDHYQVAQQPAG